MVRFRWEDSVATMWVYMALCVSGLLCGISSEVVTQETSQFEAAFQGRCGGGSPCTQLCRELHDGTYECGCRDGYLLALDGYSCFELNSTHLNDFDTEEIDVLYQKDASFSAELDLPHALSKMNRTPVTIPNPEEINIAKDLYKSYEFTDEDKYGVMRSKPIHIENRNTRLDNNVDYNPTSDVSFTTDSKYISISKTNLKENILKGFNFSYDGDRYKEIEGLNSLISEGLSRKDINMITDPKSRLTESLFRTGIRDRAGSITTLGPSLEQKVPDMSDIVPPGSTEAAAVCEARCGPGATCDLERCVCPLGRSGEFCEREWHSNGGALHFGGRGWLALPPLRAAYKRVRLRMRVRPTRAPGILLLTGERDDMAGDYFALIITHDQHLELRFDCGSGAGVLRSPERVRLHHWNTVSLYRHRWDAWMKLNSGKRIKGRSKGLFSRMTFRSAVWVGGAGNTSDLDARLGSALQSRPAALVGCISALRINGRDYTLARDAVAGYDISDCQPLPLPPTSSPSPPPCPCRHGGACVPELDARSCLCPLGYGGTLCEIALDLKIPRFNGSSYLRYPGLGATALTELDIQIVFKASNPDGLVVYNAQHSNGTGDFFALYLQDGYVEFAFDLGSGINVVRSASRVSLQAWHCAWARRGAGAAVLRVDGGEGVGARVEGGDEGELSLSTHMYLGGAPDYTVLASRTHVNVSFDGCIQKLVINGIEHSIVSSALGGLNVDNCEHECASKGTCMPDSEHLCHCRLKDGECETEKNILEKATKQNATFEKLLQNYNKRNHTDTSIHSSIVPKKGIYKNHHKSDDSRESNKIHPTHSHSKHRKFLRRKHIMLSKLQSVDSNGNTNTRIVTSEPAWVDNNIYNDRTYMRDDEQPRNDMEWSDDDSFPSFSGRDSYIHIDDTETMKILLSYALDVNIRFKSVTSHGLLLWTGRRHMGSGDDFLSLGIEDGVLVLRYDLGSGEVVIVANHTRVDDGLWHRARATRNRQAGVLEVDGMGSVGKISPGRLKQLNTDNGLFIGGMPSIWSNTVSRYSAGVEGCISHLSLSGNFEIPLSLNNLPHTITNNVGRCVP